MADYRIYCLDEGGKLDFADQIEAASDEAAIAKARELHPNAERCEIWSEDRMVAQLDATGQYHREKT